MPVIRLTPRQLKTLRSHWAEYVRVFEADYIDDDSGFQMEIDGDIDTDCPPDAEEKREVKRKHKFILMIQNKINAAMEQ